MRPSSVLGMTMNALTRSQIYVLDQDEALDFYVGKLGFEVNTDVDLGFMRWLTVNVPGDRDREILLEKPGPPALDPATAEQVRELLTKGAMGAGSPSRPTTRTRRTRRWSPRASRSPTSRPSGPTGSTSASATRSETRSASARCGSRAEEGGPVTKAMTFPLARPAEAVGRDRLLLVGGMLAGPIFVGSALVQGFTRDGFDFRRHPVSVLSTGELGWIQILTFLVTGLLAIGAARALTRVAPDGTVWLPRLFTLYGIGLVGAGVFSADPGDGFPAGTPAVRGRSAGTVDCTSSRRRSPSSR